MDFLVFYDYASNLAVTALSLGTVAACSSDDIVLRVANTSDTFQAEDVTVTVSTGGDGSQLWLSLDGDVFAASIEIGDIPPDSLCPPFWLRRVTASTEPDGDCATSITATPTGWTYTVDNSTSDNIALPTPDNPPDDE